MLWWCWWWVALVVIVPSWFLSKTVKASLKVARSSEVKDSRILFRSASLKAVIPPEKYACKWLPTVADGCQLLPMVAQVKRIRKGKMEGESTFIFSCCTFMFLVPATCCRQLSNHVKLCYFVGTALLISKSNIQHQTKCSYTQLLNLLPIVITFYA